jgi:hypothetical protein
VPRSAGSALSKRIGPKGLRCGGSGSLARAREAATPLRREEDGGAGRLVLEGRAVAADLEGVSLMQVSASRRSFFVLGAVTLALGAGAGAATIAGGQGSAGPPTGTLAFKIRFTAEKSRGGINPAVPRDKKRPKVADIEAGNADVLSMDGQKIGRAHGVDVTTFEGAKKYKGKAIQISTDAIDLGGGNFLFAHCVGEDSPTNNLCAIVGGTGRFGGARGSGVLDFVHGVEDKKNKTFTVPVTVTFVP